jgi:hypothetical protein
MKQRVNLLHNLSIVDLQSVFIFVAFQTMHAELTSVSIRLLGEDIVALVMCLPFLSAHARQSVGFADCPLTCLYVSQIRGG